MKIVNAKTGSVAGKITRTADGWEIDTKIRKLQSVDVVRKTEVESKIEGYTALAMQQEDCDPADPDYLDWYADAIAMLGFLLEEDEEDRAFCPTGPGGGVDNSCGKDGQPADSAGKGGTVGADKTETMSSGKNISYAGKKFPVGARGKGYAHQQKQLDAAEYFNDVDLTSAEQDACSTYSGSGYSKLNSDLRLGKSLDETWGGKTMVPRLDSAISKATTKKSMVVHRGFHDSYVPSSGGSRKISDTFKAGSVWQDSGYSSTSTYKGGKLGQDIHMKILLPKGSNALFMGVHGSLSYHGSSESEVLLPRDSKFRIHSVAPRNKYGVIHVEATLERK